MNLFYWVILAALSLIILVYITATICFDRKVAKARALLPNLIGDEPVACSQLRLRLREAGVSFSFAEFYQFMSIMRDERIVFVVDGRPGLTDGHTSVRSLAYILSPRGRGMLYRGLVS